MDNCPYGLPNANAQPQAGNKFNLPVTARGSSFYLGCEPQTLLKGAGSMAGSEQGGGDMKAAAVASLNASWGEMAAPEAPSADEKLWGMLANLLGLFFLVGPIVAFVLKGNSKFVKFYALQMICWNVIAFAFCIVLGTCFQVLAAVPMVGMLVINVLSPLISLVFLAALIILALKANSGVIFRLPLVGQFAFGKAYATQV
jgi:uncharacterized membrane protein